MNRHLLFGILFLSFSSLTLSAQETTRQWISATYEAFESKQSTLKLSQRFRWREQEFHLWISEVDYKTDLGNGFSGGLELRYLIESDRRGAVQGNRSSGRVRLNLYHEVRFGSFELENRAGLQYRQRFDDGDDELVFRFRPQITPKIKNFKHDPTFGVEYLQNINVSPDYSIRYRIEVPFKWEHNRFELGYFFEQFNLLSQPDQHVIFLNYQLSR